MVVKHLAPLGEKVPALSRSTTRIQLCQRKHLTTELLQVLVSHIFGSVPMNSLGLLANVHAECINMDKPQISSSQCLLDMAQWDESLEVHGTWRCELHSFTVVCLSCLDYSQHVHPRVGYLTVLATAQVDLIWYSVRVLDHIRDNLQGKLLLLQSFPTSLQFSFTSHVQLKTFVLDLLQTLHLLAEHQYGSLPSWKTFKKLQ